MAGTQTASQRITEEVTSWPGVEAGPGRRGEFAFKRAGREIGHLHGDHAAHFSFPKDVWMKLREQGRITEHPVFPGKVGPAARRIDGDGDVDDVIALMRLNYERRSEPRSRPSRFSEGELAYLTTERRLARLATVGPDGTPHVVPVGFSYNAERDSIDVGGHDLAQTKKYRDVKRSGRAAIVVDDLASTDPWRPRAVEVRGRAEVVDRPRTMIRIHPDRIRSWGLGERAAGDAGTDAA